MIIKLPDGFRVHLDPALPGGGCLVSENGTRFLIVVSVSGGKDSTALILALREAGIPCVYVFADTQWEAEETYGYLDTLRAKLGIVITAASNCRCSRRRHAVAACDGACARRRPTTTTTRTTNELAPQGPASGRSVRAPSSSASSPRIPARPTRNVLIDAAYPFGMRKYYPYQQWLEERRVWRDRNKPAAQPQYETIGDGPLFGDK